MSNLAAPFARTVAALMCAILTLAGPALAQNRSGEQDRSGEQHRSGERDRSGLFAALKAARSEAEGRAVEDKIWRSWFMAPNPAAQALLDEGVRARESYDFEGAERVLDDLIKVAPDYAEGWNQRAFVRFLRENYEGSLSDIDRALALEPKHFGALSGRAHVLFRQGRAQLALKALRQAVEIHPWLKERGMLPPEAQPKNGVDL